MFLESLINEGLMEHLTKVNERHGSRTWNARRLQDETILYLVELDHDHVEVVSQRFGNIVSYGIGHGEV